MAELQTVLISLPSLENWLLKAELTLLNSALTLWSIKRGHQGRVTLCGGCWDSQCRLQQGSEGIVLFPFPHGNFKFSMSRPIVLALPTHFVVLWHRPCCL